MLPHINKFPLMVLPENESYSGHGDDHTNNFSWKLWRRIFFSKKKKGFKQNFTQHVSW